jgi:hypothetical protein
VTIAPLASGVVYTVWPDNRKVPLFNARELKDVACLIYFLGGTSTS